MWNSNQSGLRVQMLWCSDGKKAILSWSDKKKGSGQRQGSPQLSFLCRNLSMSTTWVSYELVNAHSHGASYELVHLQLSALTGTPKLFFECYPLIFKGHVLLWCGDFQRPCLTLMWWFCSAACLPYIETSLPQHRNKSCLQICTCWKLERDAWAALVWWTLFRDSCLEVFLANTETEIVMMLRLRLRLKPSAQGWSAQLTLGADLLHD